MITNDSESSQRIMPLNYFYMHCVGTLCRSSKEQSYRRLLNRSEKLLAKEFDIRKFIQRQHVAMTALLGILSGPQIQLVDHQSKKLINESSVTASDCSDSDYEIWSSKTMDFVHKLTRSQSKVDERIMKLYRLQRLKSVSAVLGEETSQASKEEVKTPKIIIAEKLSVPRQ